ncbi:unnamed protein product [Meganyctiphanes norvegica]|uniref:C-type lectin domain-containing protein n=1 Tax=Meganyctiphanes norvegica TaxID=48144 RepID=A0AAV2SRE3_MEGNR
MCSLEYISIAGECFHFGGIDEEDKRNWYDAQTACKDQGDQLAMPGDVTAFLKYIGKQNNTYADYFVGGRYDYHQEMWKWLNGTNITIESNFWTKNNPREYSKVNETHCLAVFPSNGKLFDRICEHKKSYICQTTPELEDEAHLNQLYIAVGAILLIIVLLAVALSIYIYKKRIQSKSNVLVPKVIAEPSGQRQPARHVSENSLYEQANPTGENISRIHDSENGLYEQI